MEIKHGKKGAETTLPKLMLTWRDYDVVRSCQGNCGAADLENDYLAEGKTLKMSPNKALSLSGVVIVRTKTRQAEPFDCVVHAGTRLTAQFSDSEGSREIGLNFGMCCG